MKKIYTEILELQNVVKNLKKEGKKIIWTNGCFDIIHPGHLHTFKEAKKLGDILVVGLNSDKSPYWLEKPGRPINNEDSRSLMLEGLANVDFIYLYDQETPLLPIQALLPDILIKGGDYNIKDIVGYQEVVENGGEVLTIPFLEGYSTTNIVNKILTAYKN